MKVYTYFSQIDCLNDPDLLRCWHDSWLHHGWEPVTLNESDANTADPDRVIRYLRSPLMLSCPGNPVAYTTAALLRWVAMTSPNITESCLHVDWDVMCNGLKPEDITFHDPIPTFLAGSTCPCAVAATPKGWKMFAAALEMAPWMPRFSATELLKDSCDQYAASIFPPEFFYIQPGCPCKLYLEQEGWESAPLIHFPTRLTSFPRSATVRKFLAK